MSSDDMTPGRQADEAAERQRAIQSRQDQLDASRSRQEAAAGGRQGGQGAGSPYPTPPLQQPHLAKPGQEANMSVRPQFLAPAYKGSGKLEGKVALVTGGDSGIGRAVAVLYAREGADVGIIYLDEHEDAQETRKYVEAEGQRCITLAGDVKDYRFCEHAVATVAHDFGHLDILVNNAAFQEHAQSLEDITDERFDETMRTNVYGYFHMAKAALPYLKRGDAIINTGSVVGLRGSKHLLDYATTKGAIHAFTMSLAANLVDKGIRVNAVAPGPVWTPLNPADQPAGQIENFGKDTSIGRPAQPEELSPSYVFLAADACASYITGIVLPVTGSVGH